MPPSIMGSTGGACQAVRLGILKFNSRHCLKRISLLSSCNSFGKYPWSYKAGAMSSTIAVGSRTSGKTTQPANHAGKPTRSSTRMRSRPAATPQPLQPQPARSARLEIIELSSDNENDYGRLEPLSKRKRNRTPQQAPELKDRNEAPDPRRRKQGDEILLDSLRAELNRVTKVRTPV